MSNGHAVVKIIINFLNLVSSVSNLLAEDNYIRKFNKIITGIHYRNLIPYPDSNLLKIILMMMTMIGSKQGDDTKGRRRRRRRRRTSGGGSGDVERGHLRLVGLRGEIQNGNVENGGDDGGGDDSVGSEEGCCKFGQIRFECGFSNEVEESAAARAKDQNVNKTGK